MVLEVWPSGYRWVPLPGLRVRSPWEVASPGALPLRTATTPTSHSFLPALVHLYLYPFEQFSDLVKHPNNKAMSRSPLGFIPYLIAPQLPLFWKLALVLNDKIIENYI